MTAAGQKLCIGLASPQQKRQPSTSRPFLTLAPQITTGSYLSAIPARRQPARRRRHHRFSPIFLLSLLPFLNHALSV